MVPSGDCLNRECADDGSLLSSHVLRPRPSARSISNSMNPTEIEFAVKDLIAKPYDPATFVFDLIDIYNAPKTTVSKLKSGQTNATTKLGEVLWKKHLYFRAASALDDVAAIGDDLVLEPLTVRYKPRFILVTNGDQVHIRDLMLDDTCNTEFSRLDEFSDFLGPLAGFERRALVNENPADVKAAKRVAKLYDAILAANPTWSDGNHTHELNLFITRTLFCFYAEDTGIFDVPQVFTNTVTQATKEDGSDVAPLLDDLFRIMNIEPRHRPASTPTIVLRFPFVNGSLFEATLPIPSFNRTARRLFLECGELDWKTINADIFGSMIQTIAQPGSRGDLGMHYTSVPNIMKVLQPLMLDNLDEAYEKAKDHATKLEALLARLAGIRLFDPACGSGNFLIIAYKELRRLEMRILRRIAELAPNNPLRLSAIHLSNFYGMDIVDFACETAKLSLWIVDYQMNSEFKELFGTVRPPLPLARITTIRNGNAIRTDWQEICPRDSQLETYVCGNPPYQGGKKQSPDEKSDVALIFGGASMYKNIDYVACWFVKAASYIAETGAHAAFVATNSVCQGENVPILWPRVYAKQVEIEFAYTSFRWTNNASHNAGITCIIVGLQPANPKTQKLLYTDEHVRTVENIGPYLTATQSVVVDRAANPLQGLPEMVYGNKPLDWGHLTLSTAEKEQICGRYPDAEHFMRRYYGSDEFIDGLERWCLWISDDLRQVAEAIPPIKKRFAECRKAREAGGLSARSNAATPHRFMVTTHQETEAMLVPMVSAERRRYLQIGMMPPTVIINSNAYAVYDPPAFLFALLSSRMHAVWTAAIAGRMRNDPRYSNSYVYNTFPVPTLSEEQRKILADHSKAILRARTKYPGKTIAWLYNPETMPTTLLEAHLENDAFIEEYVYGRVFKDDTTRLDRLFALYARMRETIQGQGRLLTQARSA